MPLDQIGSQMGTPWITKEMHKLGYGARWAPVHVNVSREKPDVFQMASTSGPRALKWLQM